MHIVQRLLESAAVRASVPKPRLIPSPHDHDRWAQSRMPMDMMVQGRSMSLFQASQQWSTVRQPVIAHELPDILHRVELGRAGREEDDGDVLRRP
jgi:hypothetical protein